MTGRWRRPTSNSSKASRGRARWRSAMPTLPRNFRRAWRRSASRPASSTSPAGARRARAQLESNPAAESTLVALQADAERVLADLRELVGGIHPAVLSDRGLGDASEERAERLPVPVAVDADAAVRGNRYPDEIESAAFFLVSEAVANALKHASPRALPIPPRERHGWLSGGVRDAGPGFDATKATGSGLRGVADRIEAVRGRFWVDTGVGRGTAVGAFLPAGKVPHD